MQSKTDVDTQRPWTEGATERTNQAAVSEARALRLSLEVLFHEGVRDLRMKPRSQDSWSHQETGVRDEI